MGGQGRWRTRAAEGVGATQGAAYGAGDGSGPEPGWGPPTGTALTATPPDRRHEPVICQKRRQRLDQSEQLLHCGLL